MYCNTKWKSSCIVRNTVRKNGKISGGRKSFSTIHSISESTGERTVKKLRLSKALTISDDTTVLDACRRMVTVRADAALLTDSSGLLCGIITDKDVTTRVVAENMKPEETPVSKVMTRNPVYVINDTLAVEALQKMVQGKFRHLPVVQDGEVTALLDITKCLYDAIARMERAAEKGNAIAAAVEGVERQWGNTDLGSVNLVDALRAKLFRPSLESIIHENSKVAIVSPSDTIYMASKKMRELRVNSAIVSTNNKPQGILTSKDILMRVVSKNLSADLTAVAEVMTPNPVCVTINMTIVDALHTMHDGKFLHLPVVDRDGYIIACLDVLHLTHAALAIVGTDGGENADMSNVMMHKFLDSALLWEPAGEDDDSQSDVSIPKSYAENYVSDEIKYTSEDTFSFKLEDLNGKVYRFQSGTESLAELTSTIVQRVEMDNDQPLHITYLDEDGDHVVLLSNNDLVAAVSHARLLGWKTLKLHLDFSHSSKHQSSHCQEPRAEKAEKTCIRMDSREEWISPQYTTVLMGVVMLVGMSTLIYLSRH